MEWVEILSALLTLGIAIIGSLIAYRQLRLAKSNSREKLFDQRYKVLQRAKNLAYKSIDGPKTDIATAERELLEVLGEAEYLFSPKIHDNMLKLHNLSRIARRSRSRLDLQYKNPDKKMWEDVSNEISANDKAVLDMVKKIDALTAPYMDLAGK
ncbi:hypothetical protein AB1M95_15520 [Sulfitobacter sp. LCG007]